jgi:hypothetical protein
LDGKKEFSHGFKKKKELLATGQIYDLLANIKDVCQDFFRIGRIGKEKTKIFYLS